MILERTSGILAHPTCFPSSYGIGDLGKGAYTFVDFLKKGKQQLWQVLPLGPTGFGDSPYQSFSTFAGNPLLISPDILAKENLLLEEELQDVPPCDPNRINYGEVINYKTKLMKKAHSRFDDLRKEAYIDFCKDNAFWLEDYALFMALKNHFSGAIWNSWPEDIKNRDSKSVAGWKEQLKDDISFHKFLQYTFFKQWNALKYYANRRNIAIIGDIPIFVAMDSADVWANPELFLLDKKGKPKAVAGVPPDYFSETGQLWGNPLYDWPVHAKDKFSWWQRRVAGTLAVVDKVRIDHFRGFESYWAIPYGEKTAIKGQWQKGPGEEFFLELKRVMGDLPIIAEDLGIIDDSVRELRDKLGLPGMKVLHFAFSGDAKNLHLPHSFDTVNAVVYSGTHDNDTSLGWYQQADDYEQNFYRRYMNVHGSDVSWDMIRLAYSTIACYAIVPIQDVMSLGPKARMNTPGVAGGNWQFRYKEEMLTDNMAYGLAYLTELYDRFTERE